MTLPTDVEPRGGLLHVHGFAEELNRCRRMVALAATSFAEAGWAVLQIDAHGCGDSVGDFSDANWETWLADLDRGWACLTDTTRGPVVLWTVRTGSLLACDWMASRRRALPMVSWQPVTSGKQFLTQFLRIRASTSTGADSGGAISELRQSLRDGRAVNVAGYELSATLARDLEGAAFELPREHGAPVALLEVDTAEPPELSPVTDGLARRLRDAGVGTFAKAVPGPRFWQTAETTLAMDLVPETLSMLQSITA